MGDAAGTPWIDSSQRRRSRLAVRGSKKNAPGRLPGCAVWGAHYEFSLSVAAVFLLSSENCLRQRAAMPTAPRKVRIPPAAA